MTTLCSPLKGIDSFGMLGELFGSCLDRRSACLSTAVVRMGMARAKLGKRFPHCHIAPKLTFNHCCIIMASYDFYIHCCIALNMALCLNDRAMPTCLQQLLKHAAEAV